MLIRNIYKDDIDSVIELLQHSKPYVRPHHPYVYWMLQNYFSSSNLVAIEDNEIIGFVGALPSQEKNTLFIWQIAVDTDYRGQEVGLELLFKLKECADNIRINSFEFSIDKANESSKVLFGKFAHKLNESMIQIDELKNGNDFEALYRVGL